MDMRGYYPIPDEKPLDSIPANGGFCRIFRKIGCIGDSLSSGEFELRNEDGTFSYYDMYEYSWGQHIARMTGCTVYNFSRGGMTAKEYYESFAEQCGYWNPDKACQAYIIALGCNEYVQKLSAGTMADVDFFDYRNNNPTFTGYYAAIIQRLKTIQPRAKFFLMTMPRCGVEERDAKSAAHAKLLYELAEFFDYTYVLDLNKYAPVYDAEFKKNFYLGGHMNPMGYMLTAKMTMSYIDYIIRHNMEDFAQVGFIGKGVHNYTAKW